MTSDSESQSGEPTPKSWDEESCYDLPEWFLTHNLKIPAQLKEIKPKIRWIMKDESTETDANAEEIGYGVSRQTFLAVRDTLSALAVIDSRDRLPLYSMGATIQCKFPESAEVCTEYVHALAKELNATVATVSLNDLRALATNFDLQEAERFGLGPTTRDRDGECYRRDVHGSLGELPHPADEALIYYFGQKCKRHAGCNHERTKRAYGSLVGIQPANADRNPKTKTSNVPGHLIIHVADAQLLLPVTHRRVLSRLREAVFDARSHDIPVTLLITAQLDTNSNQHQYRQKTIEDGRLFQIKGGTPPAATFVLDKVVIPEELKKRAVSANSVSDLFILGLKSLLRQYADQRFEPELLLPNTSWDLKVDEPLDKLDGKDVHFIERVAVQILGRGWGKKKLGLEEIAEVVREASHCEALEKDDETEGKGADCESNSGSSSSGSSSSSKNNSRRY